LRLAGFVVRKGDNDLRPGIAAASARLESGQLRVVEGACPNLLAKAGLYRYGDSGEDRSSEVPRDEHNHALAALRYLISRLDAGTMARLRKRGGSKKEADDAPSPGAKENRPPAERRWLSVRNEQLWTRVQF
jgi:hypothetical protein